MNQNLKILERLFGEAFLERDNRIKSYRYLQDFLERKHTDWSSAPDTKKIVDALLDELSSMTLEQFSFLLCHSGYIPEEYLPDSSKETLYSKLIETLVLEWARRIGFDLSVLPTQKSSTEDVTIQDSDCVIVCDTKSFRLGRSQAAPNVKDVLKYSDISKWLNRHSSKIQLGGLVTFPSQHDWKKSSDFYQYTTDKSLPTICLYYEHLSLFLLTGTDKETIISTFKDYGNIFPKVLPKTINNREQYYRKIITRLFDKTSNEYEDFSSASVLIVKELVFFWDTTLNGRITEITEEITSYYESVQDIQELRSYVINSERKRKTEINTRINSVRKC